MVVPYGITIFECMHTRFSLTKGCIHLGKIVYRREPVENGDIPASYVRKYQKVGYVCLRHFSEKKSSQPSTLGLTLRSAKLIGLHNAETSPPLPGCWLRQSISHPVRGGGKFRITRFAKNRIHRSKPEETMENTTTLSTPDRFFLLHPFVSQKSGGTNKACKDWWPEMPRNNLHSDCWWRQQAFFGTGWERSIPETGEQAGSFQKATCWPESSSKEGQSYQEACQHPTCWQQTY